MSELPELTDQEAAEWRLDMDTDAERAHPLVKDGDVIRFKPNRVVRAMMDAAMGTGPRCGPNEIAIGVAEGRFTDDERREVMRQIGYSVCGYWELFPSRDPETGDDT